MATPTENCVNLEVPLVWMLFPDGITRVVFVFLAEAYGLPHPYVVTSTIRTSQHGKSLKIKREDIC